MESILFLHHIGKTKIKRIMKAFILLMVAIQFIGLNFAQAATFTGYVYHQTSKKPVSGVDVSVKNNPKIKVTTQANGYFKIAAPNTSATTIVFSSTNFKTKEITVKNPATVLKVYLEPDAVLVSDVVQEIEFKEVSVIGYETVRKSELTAGVVSYSSSNIKYDNRVANPFLSQSHSQNTETYNYIQENEFKTAKDNPLSTFSIDVDAASYSNIRRFIQQGQLPPKDAVRIEEMINYFNYSYPEPKNNDPVSISTELTEAPWNKRHQLLKIGLKARTITNEKLPPANLVFLIDVSGSMYGRNRLEMLKTALNLLINQLREEDKVAIVVYAGAAGVVLPSTSGSNKIKIKEALNNLQAGGSTAGGAGIKLAYQIAESSFVKGGNNRIILATDGDFNVGASSDSEMQHLIEEERNKGVFLTVLGFGMGNYKDSKMEVLANKGNGNYAYIDNMSEARKVLVNEFGSTLYTVAKDVKLQLEFNPAKVKAYRLVGYENRLLNNEDFKDDAKDAGEMGVGHTVTALYEIIPQGVNSSFIKETDALKYQQNTVKESSTELLTVKMRYKEPDGDKSKLMSVPVTSEMLKLENASADLKFAAAVAQFGMLLRGSEYQQNTNLDNTLRLAQSAKENDKEGYKAELIQLIKNTKLLMNK